MLIKVIVIFLLVMVLIGMIGKLVFPATLPRQSRWSAPRKTMKTCPHCHRPQIGKTCSCKAKA